MGYLNEFYKVNQKTVMAFAVILILFCGIAFLKKFISGNRKKNELEQASADKLRDENLNSVILNAKAGCKDRKEVYVPYDVDYSRPNGEGGHRNKFKRNYSGRYGKKHRNCDSGNTRGREKGHIMLQLVERTELSTRKFMMNPAKTIRIGSSLQDNDITVLADQVSSHQCEIFAVGSKVYIRNLGSECKTVIRRKKVQAIVDGNGVRLISGDTVILGNVFYDVAIVDHGAVFKRAPARKS